MLRCHAGAVAGAWYHVRGLNSACGVCQGALPNNGMHPTANSVAFIKNLPLPAVCARRVMPGVRCQLRPEYTLVN